MSGFLDRLGARAVSEAPLVHPRVPSRFEPGIGELPGGPVDGVGPVAEIAEVEEVAAVPRMKVQRLVEVPTFEPEPRRLPVEGGTIPPSDPPREGEMNAFPPRRTPALERFVAPPLQEDGSTDGRGDRRVRVHGASPPQEPLHTAEHSAPLPAFPSERRRLALASPKSVEPPQAPPLRSRSTLDEGLSTVKPDRHAPVPHSLEESEPPETVVHVSIGRIDVRAVQPPAPERRPARPTGPRLTLADYLKRREERR